MSENIEKNEESQEETGIPCFISNVSAGFPSPAADYIESNLDLNEHLIKHRAATFFVKASGNSMISAGIFDGDMLIVDRSLNARNNSVVIAIIDGEFTVKRLKIDKKHTWLAPENPDYPTIKIEEDNSCQIWGVVTYVIKSML
jgi:DNA polymerase V